MVWNQKELAVASMIILCRNELFFSDNLAVILKGDRYISLLKDGTDLLLTLIKEKWPDLHLKQLL